MQTDSQDTGLVWIYVLVFIFTLVIVQFTILPVLNSYLVPALVSSTTDDAGFVEEKINNVMNIVRITMYLFYFVAFIYALLAIFKRERRDYYV